MKLNRCHMLSEQTVTITTIQCKHKSCLTGKVGTRRLSVSSRLPSPPSETSTSDLPATRWRSLVIHHTNARARRDTIPLSQDPSWTSTPHDDNRDTTTIMSAQGTSYRDGGEAGHADQRLISSKRHLWCSSSKCGRVSPSYRSSSSPSSTNQRRGGTTQKPSGQI